jgi:hypothetical protein
VPTSEGGNESEIGVQSSGEAAISPPLHLGEMFGFAASELAANRDGRMAARQRVRFFLRAFWRTAIAVPLVILAAYAGLNAYEFWPIGLSALATMFALYLAWRSFSFAADAVDGEVSIVEGGLEKKHEYNYRSIQYYAFVGELKIRISGGVQDRLPAGLTCRAYYAPAASALLSLEPLLEVAAPMPSRPFGRKAARSIARGLPTAVLLAVGGSLAIVLGVHLFADARPATFSAASGPISGYRETARPASYYVSVDGYEYELLTPPYDFSPPLPDLNRLTGTVAHIYLDDRSGEVAAIYLDRMYRTDVFADREIQERDMKGGGILAVFLGLIFVAPLLIAAAVEAVVRFPVPSQRRARRVVAELERPEVAVFLQRVQALTPDQWDGSVTASPLGASINRRVLDADQWHAVHEFAEKQEPNTRLETIPGENAIAAVAFSAQLRPRDLVRMYGPLLGLIPPHTVGMKGPVAELWERHTYQAVVDSFRSDLARQADPHDAKAAKLTDGPDRVEAALCLAALDASPDEKSLISRNLIELAAFQADPIKAQIGTLEWLGDPVDLALARDLEAGTGKAADAGRVLSDDQLHDLDRQRWERGLMTGLGCSFAEVTLICAGVIPAYLWLTTGGRWGGVAVLGAAAAVMPALGRIVYIAVRRRFGGRPALLLGFFTTIAAPVAVLAIGWTQIDNPTSVAAVFIAAPAVLALLGWLALRRSSAPSPA